MTAYDSDNHDAGADLARIRRKLHGGQSYQDGRGLGDNPYDAITADWLRWQTQWEMAALAARRDLATQGAYARERAETTAVIERAGLLLELIQKQWTKPTPSIAMELRFVREAVNRTLIRLTALPTTASLVGRSGASPDAAAGSSLPAPAQAPTLGAPERPPNKLGAS